MEQANVGDSEETREDEAEGHEHGQKRCTCFSGRRPAVGPLRWTLTGAPHVDDTSNGVSVSRDRPAATHVHRNGYVSGETIKVGIG